MVLIAGCAAPSGAPPISDKSTPLRKPESEYRTVIAGDTLYSIAWESGRDYRELAAWNQISPPYTIVPGQKIRLYPPDKPGAIPQPDHGVHTVKRGETLFGIATRYDVSAAELAAWNGIRPPYTLRPGQTLRVTAPSRRTASPSAPPSARGTDRARTARAPQTSTASVPRANIQWVWPTEGAVTRTNGSSRGIIVKGRRGQPIVASAPGTVVYQGSGLRGYGQLIILKHDSDFLSAYAHCDKIVVREGDVIKRGQKIAEMGSTGADSVKLHFEIRYRGTPVNPLELLPKK